MDNTSSKNIEKEFKDLRKNLLDLTLKNQLLNFKPRAKTLTVVNQSPSNVYQSLILQDKKMYFTTSKKDEKESSKFSIWDHSPIDLSRFKDGDKTLQTNLSPKELQKRLFYINQQAKTMIDEQGYNILYLAIGFLEWVDRLKPKDKNYAPLILIPVTMERKKVGKSFELSWTGEDLQTNISLKAKLKEEGIKLPEFEKKNYLEVVDHYIKEVKQAVSRMPNWNVNSNIALGFFSFTKFVMYNDLNPESWDDNVDLTKNELIEAIFNPSKNTQEAFREEDIDTKLNYKDMYQVLDADSSQIAAIEDVKAGRNLVVEGPPGTGKSQTIVNLIAELLAEGRSVLFVSEKMAALDVVKDRLTKVGLGKFVLELHSHKTRRKKFLKELEKATNVRSENPINIDQTLRKLEKLKFQLDDYAEIIHKKEYAVQLSAFDLYGMKESADDYFSKKNTIIPLVRFSNPENITLKDLDDVIISLENLAELYQTISNENPWSKCSPKSLLPADLREIELLINDTLASLDNFLLEREKIYDVYGIKQPNSLADFDNTLNTFNLFEDNTFEFIDSNILKSNAWSNSTDAETLIKKLEEYQSLSKILDKFHSQILNINLNELIQDIKKVSNKKFSLFKNKQGAEIVEMYYKTSVPSNESIINDLEMVQKLSHLKSELESNNNLAISYFGNYWHLNASIDDLKNISTWMNKFSHLLKEGIFTNSTIDLLSKDLFNVDPRRDLDDYISSGDEFKKDLSKLESKLNPRSKLIFKKDSSDVTLEEWKNQLNNWKGQLSSLHLWSQYLNTKNSLKGTLSEEFIDIIEKRGIRIDDVRHLVLGNFADSLLNLVFTENQELATFIGELHENRIKDFKGLDKKIIELNRKRIFQRLNSNIPQIFGATNNPEAKILAGEFTRKSGHLPVRSLLEKTGGMIKQIKPCFMMSPLSIAQYLDPTNEKLQFDVVIFDEASQVKPEDALGAFMRGKTAVVMGDTQQLPPTSFFDQIAAGESGEEVAGALDMESILHLCKLSFPVKMLKWHYRSRHESLIAVSNKEFYDDELLVYPSPSNNNPDLGLKFHYNGDTVYDRGSGSVNKQEARDVVREIFNHFDKFGDTKSLGVGTFSVAQKNAILEELELERKNRPELEPLFSDKLDEKFFVKNLETIQGDERDVILISIGYGFDANRNMSLNFGPLNQDGGERRLNVLVTRAREKCVVFSNFKSYDIKLSANPPFGVKSLKEFLQYAENIDSGNIINDNISDEPFEDAIANFLTEKGYVVEKQVGCAGFRVNLAISDEESYGQYMLGILTDGKMYSSSKVARDRDRLREQVLEGLGWKLYRLWSTDWYRNRDLTQEKLLEAINSAKKIAIEEETKKSEEAKKLSEKLKKEAEKRALELKKQEEEKLVRENEENSVENIPIKDDLDNDEIIEIDTYIGSDNKEDSYDEIVEIDTAIGNSFSNYKESKAKDNSSKDETSSIIHALSETNRDVVVDENDYVEISTSTEEDDYLEPVNNVKDFIKPDEIPAIKEDLTKTDEISVIEPIHDDISTVESVNTVNDSSVDVIEPIHDELEEESGEEDKGIFNNIIKSLTQSNNEEDKEEEKDEDSIFSKVKFKSSLNLNKNNDLHSIASSSTYEDSKDEDNNSKNNDLDNEISIEDNEITVDNDDELINDDENYEEDVSLNDKDEIQDEYVSDKYISPDLNEGISPKNNEKDFTDKIIEEDNYSNEIANEIIKEDKDSQDDNHIRDEYIESKNQDNETYEGVSGIENPLKKNTIFKTKQKRSFLENIEYLNKSLNEIENPTPAEYVQIIDRTEEDIIDNNVSKSAKDILENNIISSPSNKMEKSNNLENMIESISENYKALEKERLKKDNKFKQLDDSIILDKGDSLDNEIENYKYATTVGLENNDIYSLSDDSLSSSISKIVEVEGPIHKDELIKRIKDLSNTNRSTAKFKSAINEGIKYAESLGKLIFVDDFIYDANNHNIAIRRREKPNIDFISQEEIEKNIETTLKFKQSLDSKSLIKEVSRNFGFKSTSKKTSTRVSKVLDMMLADEKIIASGDRIELK